MILSDEKKAAYARIMLDCKEGALRGNVYQAMVLGMWCHYLNQKNPLPLDTNEVILDAWQNGFAASIQATQIEAVVEKLKKKKKK